MAKKEDFKFDTRHLGNNVFETILTNKKGIKFGCKYQAACPAEDYEIFRVFKENFKEVFFIDVEAVVVDNKPITKDVKQLPFSLDVPRNT